MIDKNKIGVILTLLLYINMMTIVNYIFEQIDDTSLFNRNSLILLVISWLPFLLTILLILTYSTIMYNDQFKKAWKYVYLNCGMLIVNLISLLMLKDIMKNEKYIVNGCITVVFGLIMLFEWLIQSIKVKNNYSEEEELTLIEKENKQKRALMTKESKTMRRMYIILFVFNIIEIQKALFSMGVVLLILYYIQLVVRKKYNYYEYLQGVQFVQLKMVLCNSICLLLAISFYKEVWYVISFLLLMLSRFYPLFLEWRVMRMLYDKVKSKRCIVDKKISSNCLSNYQ